MLSIALSIVFSPVSSKTNALAERTVSETAEKRTDLHSSPFSQAWTHQINVPSSSRMMKPKIEMMAVASVLKSNDIPRGAPRGRWLMTCAVSAHVQTLKRLGEGRAQWQIVALRPPLPQTFPDCGTASPARWLTDFCLDPQFWIA